jgi:hypothetical protein
VGWDIIPVGFPGGFGRLTHDGGTGVGVKWSHLAQNQEATICDEF